MLPGCTFEYELWGPHPGCREFMDEPEAVVTCGAPAAAVAVVIDAFPNDDATGYAEELTVQWACLEHASPLAAIYRHDPYLELVAFAGTLPTTTQGVRS